MSFKKFLSRVLGLEPAEVHAHAPRPVRSGKHQLAMESVSAQERVLQLFGNDDDRVLSVSLDGKDSAVYFERTAQRAARGTNRPAASAVDAGFAQVPGSETAALQLYASMRTAVLGRASGGLSRTAALLLAGPVALVVAVLLFTPSVDSRANNAQARMNSPGVVISPAGAVYAGGAAPVAAAPMPPPAPVSVPKDAYVDEGERKQLAKLAGVAPLRPSGKEFYVFTDPNCPFCKDLEPTLEAAASGMKPIVIPVAFKDGSRDLAAAALCSSNPAAEWKKLMATGLPPLAKPCAKGFERVEENMRLFQQLRLTATPTIVSPKGLLVSGAVTPDELARILVN